MHTNPSLLPVKRKRLYYVGLLLFIIPLGLASRKFANSLPLFLAKYTGDVLWAAMVYLGIAFIWPTLSLARTTIAALAFCYAIEVSQFCQADWLNAIRHTTLGALVLGFGFLWSDIVCYTVGIVLALALDTVLTKQKALSASV